MPATFRSKKKSHTAVSEGQAGRGHRDDDRLISRIRRVVAEAGRLSAWHSGADRGDGKNDHVHEFRRRVLLMKEETEVLLRQLKAAGNNVDGEIRAMASQAVAISAYTQCRRVGRQYAREVRGRK
jgi:hypothetical protein